MLTEFKNSHHSKTFTYSATAMSGSVAEISYRASELSSGEIPGIEEGSIDDLLSGAYLQACSLDSAAYLASSSALTCYASPARGAGRHEMLRPEDRIRGRGRRASRQQTAAHGSPGANLSALRPLLGALRKGWLVCIHFEGDFFPHRRFPGSSGARTCEESVI